MNLYKYHILTGEHSVDSVSQVIAYSAHFSVVGCGFEQHISRATPWKQGIMCTNEAPHNPIT